MKGRVLLVVILLAAGQVRAQEMPRLADERIVLHTVAGDLVLALFPDVAPEHVRQLLQLVRLGVYDSLHFHRVEKGFVVQISNQYGRAEPLTPAQQQAIHPLKAEFSSLPHRRGILSMARADGDPNSAETSFSILLGEAKHLDGQYTVFGCVEYGMDVIDKFLEVPQGESHQPLVRLEVRKAEVVPVHLLPTISLAGAKSVSLPPELTAAMNESRASASAAAVRKEVLGGIGFMVTGTLLMMSVGLVNFFFAPKLPGRYVLALNLICVLIGGFVLFVILTPIAMGHSWFAACVFLSLLSLLKLMSRFESPA
jgi:cyclophilin family peptidyl-prolyl cis-trans isomerase